MLKLSRSETSELASLHCVRVQEFPRCSLYVGMKSTDGAGPVLRALPLRVGERLLFGVSSLYRFQARDIPIFTATRPPSVVFAALSLFIISCERPP
jgi:hypothetical protein